MGAEYIRPKSPMEQKSSFSFNPHNFEARNGIFRGWLKTFDCKHLVMQKVVARTMMINTTNSYCSVSIYYAPNSILRILYASPHPIFKRPYEENSASISILQ